MSLEPPVAKPARPPKGKRLTLLVLCILGVCLSGILLRMSLPLPNPQKLFGVTLCSPSDHVNCGYVLGSRWAKIGSIPTAALGLIYFAGLGLWFLAVGLPNIKGRRWHLIPLIATSLGFAGSLGLIYVMAARLPVWCTWCVATHVVNGLLFLMVILSWPRDHSVHTAGVSDETMARPSNLRAGLVLIGSLAVGLIFLLAAFDLFHQAMARRYQLEYLKVTNNINYITWRYQSESKHEIPIRADDPSTGNRQAPFTVVVFSDFECPGCREFHHYVDRLVSQFPGVVRFVFKHYPLSKSCNENVPRSLHHFACQAAYAAGAACAIGSDKQIQAYYQLLYENHDRFDERPYRRLAVEAGLNGEAFATQSASQEVRDHILDDVHLANQLGVTGTPAIFLNGRRLWNWQIMTADFQPKMDAARTLSLWEHLLGKKAMNHPKPTAS